MCCLVEVCINMSFQGKACRSTFWSFSLRYACVMFRLTLQCLDEGVARPSDVTDRFVIAPCLVLFRPSPRSNDQSIPLGHFLDAAQAPRTPLPLPSPHPPIPADLRTASPLNPHSSPHTPFKPGNLGFDLANTLSRWTTPREECQIQSKRLPGPPSTVGRCSSSKASLCAPTLATSILHDASPPTPATLRAAHTPQPSSPSSELATLRARRPGPVPLPRLLFQTSYAPRLRRSAPLRPLNSPSLPPPSPLPN